MKMEPTQFDNNGKVRWAAPGNSAVRRERPFRSASCSRIVAGTPTSWRSSARWSDFSEHTNANYFLHTGSGLQGRPSMGAGSVTASAASQPGPARLRRAQRRADPARRARQLQQRLPARHLPRLDLPPGRRAGGQHPRREAPNACSGTSWRCCGGSTAERWSASGGDAIESAIANYELAFRMQAAVPELTDLSGETEATSELYGFEEIQGTRIFGRQCLLARRLVERGVRFIELTCPSVGHDRWDQHGNLKGMPTTPWPSTSRSPACWPTSNSAGCSTKRSSSGAANSAARPSPREATAATTTRSASPCGWPAAASKAGTPTARPTTYGYNAVENGCEIHDLHATMLHLLGIDHERQTFRYSGRDMRLTDVHGHVVTAGERSAS
jgi:hypothetical protein